MLSAFSGPIVPASVPVHLTVTEPTRGTFVSVRLRVPFDLTASADVNSTSFSLLFKQGGFVSGVPAAHAPHDGGTADAAEAATALIANTATRASPIVRKRIMLDLLRTSHDYCLRRPSVHPLLELDRRSIR